MCVTHHERRSKPTLIVQRLLEASGFGGAVLTNYSTTRLSSTATNKVVAEGEFHGIVPLLLYFRHVRTELSLRKHVYVSPRLVQLALGFLGNEVYERAVSGIRVFRLT